MPIAVTFQIARNTFREILRDPIHLILLLCSLTLTGLLPACALFVFREQKKLVVDSSLAIIISFGWILAVLSASHTVTKEINNGTILLIISKPVKRSILILGKIIGIMTTILMFVAINSMATLIALRVAKDQFRLDYNAMGTFFGTICLACLYAGVQNYLTKKSFVMLASKAIFILIPLSTLALSFILVEGKEVSYAYELIPAFILILFAVWALSALATALSTCIDIVGNLIICFVVFIAGLMSDYVFGRFADDSYFFSILYAITPNWQLFWMADAITAGKKIPYSYVLWGGLYIILFVIIFLSIAFSIFQNREVGKNSLN